MKYIIFTLLAIFLLISCSEKKGECYYQGKPLAISEQGGCYYIDDKGDREFIDRTACDCD